MEKMPTVFSFGENQVRTIVDENGEPWFVAADVFNVLGLSHNAKHLCALDDNEKGVNSVHTPGGQQTMNVINESGLYGLTFRSRKTVFSLLAFC